jgi:hypothetical protein
MTIEADQTGIDPRRRTEVAAQLSAIEAEQDVRVLDARESGSRASRDRPQPPEIDAPRHTRFRPALTVHDESFGRCDVCYSPAKALTHEAP